MQLAELVAPESTVVLTQECQKGVLGAEGKHPILAAHGRDSGALTNMGRIVAAGRAAGCGGIHAIAAHRPDFRGANTNAPIFASIVRNKLDQTVGTPLVELIDEIPVLADDLCWLYAKAA